MNLPMTEDTGAYIKSNCTEAKSCISASYEGEAEQNIVFSSVPLLISDMDWWGDTCELIFSILCFSEWLFQYK